MAKRRQKKSGSGAKKKKKPLPILKGSWADPEAGAEAQARIEELMERPALLKPRGVEHHSDGSKTVRLSPSGVAFMKAQADAFRAKFAREPGESDPIMFDHETDEPTALPAIPPEEMEAAMLKVGIRPHVAYACAASGVILTKENEANWSEEDKEAFQRAANAFEYYGGPPTWALYWVTTADGDEDWFVIAADEDDAQTFFETQEGYDEGDATAEHIVDLPEAHAGRWGWRVDEDDAWNDTPGWPDSGDKILHACGATITPQKHKDLRAALRKQYDAVDKSVTLEGRTFHSGDIVTNTVARCRTKSALTNEAFSGNWHGYRAIGLARYLAPPKVAKILRDKVQEILDTFNKVPRAEGVSKAEHDKGIASAKKALSGVFDGGRIVMRGGDPHISMADAPTVSLDGRWAHPEKRAELEARLDALVLRGGTAMPTGLVTVMPDGATSFRRLPIHDEVVDVQLELFRAKFGRDPKGDEPLFFDPDADVVRELEFEPTAEDGLDEMLRLGVEPARAFAYATTGMHITDENEAHWLPEDRAKFFAAVAEYEALPDDDIGKKPRAKKKRK